MFQNSGSAPNLRRFYMLKKTDSVFFAKNSETFMSNDTIKILSFLPGYSHPQNHNNNNNNNYNQINLTLHQQQQQNDEESYYLDPNWYSSQQQQPYVYPGAYESNEVYGSDYADYEDDVGPYNWLQHLQGFQDKQSFLGLLDDQLVQVS